MKFCVSTSLPNNINTDSFESPMQMPAWSKTGNEESVKYLYFYIEAESKILFFSSGLISKYFKFFKTLHFNYGPDFFQTGSLVINFYLENLLVWAKNNKIDALFIEPRVLELPTKQLLTKLGFITIKDHINSSETLQLSLDKQSENELFMRLDKNCRYNVNYAIKNSVKIIKLESISISSDKENFIKFTDIFYELLMKTRERKNFFIKTKNYYKNFILNFAKNNNVVLWAAEYEGDIIAANISVFNKNIYSSVFSASKRLIKDVKSTYLLKWEGIKDALQKKSSKYDFWGATTKGQDHPFFYTTKFKKQFGGEFVHFPDTYVFKFSGVKYSLFRLLLHLGINYFFEEQSFRFFNYNKKIKNKDFE